MAPIAMTLAQRIASSAAVMGSAQPAARSTSPIERAESVGESLSRSQMHLLDFPPPLLQATFDRSDGAIDRVDFDWPEFGLFGEFDGDVKYLDPEVSARTHHRAGHSRREEACRCDLSPTPSPSRVVGTGRSPSPRRALRPCFARAAFHSAGLPRRRVTFGRDVRVGPCRWPNVTLRRGAGGRVGGPEWGVRGWGSGRTGAEAAGWRSPSRVGLRRMARGRGIR